MNKNNQTIIELTTRENKLIKLYNKTACPISRLIIDSLLYEIDRLCLDRFRYEYRLKHKITVYSQSQGNY